MERDYTAYGIYKTHYMIIKQILEWETQERIEAFHTGSIFFELSLRQVTLSKSTSKKITKPGVACYDL